jgi:hypothetical protein
VRNEHLPRFYSKHLTKTLQEAVEDALGATPREQLNLYEELAVMRATCGDLCKLYDACENKPESRAAVGEALRSALQDVVKVCESAARVEGMAKDKLSIHNLSYVIAQVVRLAHDCFGDDERAKKFEEMIRLEVRLPDETQGTLMTPDQDVGEMDDTVPKEEDT